MRSPALVSRSSNPERHAVLAFLSERYPPLEGRSPTCYSPVRHSVIPTPCGAEITAFDLHVLGTPPALILSQDQTLKFKFRLREPFDCLLFSNYLRCYFCLVSSLVTKEQLTLDGLVARFGFRPCSPPSSFDFGGTSPSASSNVCTLYLVFKEPRTTYRPPADAPSNLLDLAPALFRGTLRIYDDLPSLVNLFFAYGEKIF